MTKKLVSINDFELPKANLMRIMRAAVDQGEPSAAFQKDARLAISRAATVFINYLVACAQEESHKKNTKTITAENIMLALKACEFYSFIEPVNEKLKTYQEGVKLKKLSQAEKPPFGVAPPPPGAPVSAFKRKKIEDHEEQENLDQDKEEGPQSLEMDDETEEVTKDMSDVE